MEKKGAGKHWYGFMKMCAGCAIGKRKARKSILRMSPLKRGMSA